jgi:putative acetyltransferase
MPVTCRKANRDDINDIVALYRGTVRNVNNKDYSPEQIEVWAGGAENIERWQKAITEQYFVLAEKNGTLAGFSSLAKDGYLDFMYVHKDFQGCKVATALLTEIERKAEKQKNTEIYSHVSITARGFFEKMGYKHIKDLNDPYKGVIFINSLMVKKL